MTAKEQLQYYLQKVERIVQRMNTDAKIEIPNINQSEENHFSEA